MVRKREWCHPNIPSHLLFRPPDISTEIHDLKSYRAYDYYCSRLLANDLSEKCRPLLTHSYSCSRNYYTILQHVISQDDADYNKSAKKCVHNQEVRNLGTDPNW